MNWSVTLIEPIFGDPADIVAAKIEQHQMLGALLGIGEKFLGQGAVLGGVSPRRRVPAIGRMVTLPSRTLTRISGDEPMIANRSKSR